MGGAALRATVRANADAHAADLAEVIGDICAQEHTTLRAIAAELNARGILTRRGGRWHVSNVKNPIGRQFRGSHDVRIAAEQHHSKTRGLKLTCYSTEEADDTE